MLACPTRFLGYRDSLLRSTAMLTVLAAPALAQPAPGAHPSGGQVVGGQATITQTAGTTTINQASPRAALTWQSYDVGSGQIVRYNQPNAQSIALNTVLSANPSMIAGRITANGQIVLVNQSGVVFYRGAQVDTAGLTASATGISVQNFMAGKMVFDQAPHPGAMISNAGNITVSQAGLAALVGPLVRNSGTITATLGRVVLGAATTYTLDLYGDGLLTLNVTGMVTEVQLGGAQVPALITNTGTILANGGSIVLSAAAVDGLIQTLVVSGGTLVAPSVGAQTGRVLVQGVGGGVDIDGEVVAMGGGAGTVGGAIAVSTTGTVTLAAGARLDVSGMAGGGSVSVGSVPGAAVPIAAQAVVLASGSSIHADALQRGNGGAVTVLASRSLVHQGAISARGGMAGGNGGSIKLSTPGTLQLAGTADTSAPEGTDGPVAAYAGDVKISGDLSKAPTGPCSPGCGASNGSYWEVDATGNITVDGATNLYGGTNANGVSLTGLILDAVGSISIQYNLAADIGSLGHQSLVPLELIAGSNINVSSGAVVTASAVFLSAGGAVTYGTSPTPPLNPGSFLVNNGIGTITILEPGLGNNRFPLLPNAGGPSPATPTAISLAGGFGTLSSYSQGAYNTSPIKPASVVVTDSNSLTVATAFDTTTSAQAGPISINVTNGNLAVGASLTGVASGSQPGVFLSAAGSGAAGDIDITANVTGETPHNGNLGVQMDATGALTVASPADVTVNGQALLVAQAASIDLSDHGTLAAYQAGSSTGGTIALAANSYTLSAVSGNPVTNGAITTEATPGLVELGLFTPGTALSHATFTIGVTSPTIAASDLQYITAGTLQIGNLAAGAASNVQDIVVNSSILAHYSTNIGTLSLISAPVSGTTTYSVALGSGASITAENISITSDQIDLGTASTALDAIGTAASPGKPAIPGTVAITISTSMLGDLTVENTGMPKPLSNFVPGTPFNNTFIKAGTLALGDTINAQNLLIDGPLTQWAAYRLQAVQSITESNAGTISYASAGATLTTETGETTATSLGLTSLTNPSNIISNFSAPDNLGGTITLVSTPANLTSLTLSGLVKTSAAGTVSLTTDYGDITELDSNARVIGTIATGTLIASASTGITLTSNTNSFVTLGAITADNATGTPSGSIAIFDALGSLQTLTTTSPITTAPNGTAYGDVSLTVSSSSNENPSYGALSIGADVTALNGTFAASNGITQTAGTTIDAKFGTGPGGVQTGGTLTLGSSYGPISLLGTLQAGLKNSLYDGSITLDAQSDIAESTSPLGGQQGLILTGLLSATSTYSSVSLPNTSNVVGTLGMSSAGTLATGGSAMFLLADSEPLTIAAPVVAGATNEVGTIVLEGPPLLQPSSQQPISTTFSFASVGELTAYNSGNSIGLVAFDLIPVNLSAGPIFSFGPATLTVQGIGTFAVETLAPGALSNIHAQQLNLGWHGVSSTNQPLSNTEALYIDAPLSLTGTVGLFTSTDGPPVLGNIFTGVDNISTGVFESDGFNHGSIMADTLLGSAYAASLPGSANAISTNSVGTLGNFTVYGPQTIQAATSSTGTSFAFSDTDALTVSGTVQQAVLQPASQSPSTIAISVLGASVTGTPNDLTLDGAIINGNSNTISGTAAISLNSVGSIIQNALSTVSADSGDIFVQANNSILQTNGTITAASGNITLHALMGDIAQSDNSSITGTSGNITLTADAGSITQTSSSIISAKSGDVTLRAGSIVQIDSGVNATEGAFGGNVGAFAGTYIQQIGSYMSATNVVTATAGTSISQSNSSITAGNSVFASAGTSLTQTQSSITATSNTVSASVGTSLTQTLSSSITAGNSITIVTDQLFSSVGLTQGGGSTIVGPSVQIVSGGAVAQVDSSDLIEATDTPGSGDVGNLLIVLNGPVNGPASFSQSAGNTVQSLSGAVAIDAVQGSITIGGVVAAGTLTSGTYTPSLGGQVLLYAGQGNVAETGGVVLSPALAADAPSGNVVLDTGLIQLTGINSRTGTTTPGPTLAENQIGRLLTSSDAITLATPLYAANGGATNISGSTTASGSVTINDDARDFTSSGASYGLGDGALLIGGTLTPGGSIVAGGGITLNLYGSLVQVDDLLQSQTGSIAITAQAGTTASGTSIRSSFSVLQQGGTLLADEGNITLIADDLIRQSSASTISAGSSITNGTASLSAGVELEQSGASALSASNLVAIGTGTLPPSAAFVGFSQSGSSTIIAGDTTSTGTVSIVTAGQFNQGAAPGTGDTGGSLIEATGSGSGGVLGTPGFGDVLIQLTGITPPLGAFTQYQGSAIPNIIESSFGTIGIATMGALQFGGVLVAGSLSGSAFTPSSGGEILLSAKGNITETGGSGVVLATAFAASTPGSVLLDTGLIGLTGPTANNGAATPVTTPSPSALENQVGQLLTSADGGTSSVTGPIFNHAGGDFQFTDDARNFNTPFERDGGLLVDGAGAATQGSISIGGNLELTLYGSLLQFNSIVTANGDADLTLLAGYTGANPIYSTFSVVQQGSTLSTTNGNLNISADSSISQTASVMSAGASANLVAGASVTQTMSTISADTGTLSVIARSDSGTVGLAQSASTIEAIGNTSAGAAQIVSGGDVQQLGDSAITAPGGVTLLLDGGTPSYGNFAQTSTDLIQSTQGTVAIRSLAGSIFAAGTLLAGTDISGNFVPSAGGTILLLASQGDISESAGGGFTGRILARALAADASGNVLLLTPDQTPGTGNAVGRLLTSGDGAGIVGPDGTPAATPIYTSAGGTLALTDDTTIFAQGAPSGIGTLLLGDATGGSISSGDGITLSVIGGVSQTSSTLLATGGDIAVTATGAIAQAGSTIAALNGAVSVGAGAVIQGASIVSAASSVAISAGTGGVTQSASDIVAFGQGITLLSQGAVTQADGSNILAQGDLTILLLGASAPLGLLSQTSADLIQSAAGTLGIHSAAGNLVLAGTVMAGGTITAAGVGGGGFTAANAGTALLLADRGAITQQQSSGGFTGSIEAGALAAQAGGDLMLESANSGAAPNRFASLLTGAQSAQVAKALQSGTVTATELVSTGAGGTLSVNDDAAIIGGTLTLSAGNIAAGTGASVDVLGNLVQDGTTLTAASGNIALATQQGSLRQMDAQLDALDGSITVTAATALSQTSTILSASGGISETGLSSGISASMLTLTATGAIALEADSGGISLDSATLQSTGGSITLTSSGAASSISGTTLTLAANTIQLEAASGNVSLDSADFVAGNNFGHLPVSTAPVAFENWPQQPGQSGVLIEAKSVSFGSNGATLTPVSGMTLAGLEIRLSARNGSILFGNTGLVAPAGILLLNLDGGTATGHVAVAGLDALTAGPGITGNAGSVDLQGSVKGFGSFEAASVSEVNATQPGVIAQPSQNLRINNCALTATDCVLLPPFVPPIYALLVDFSISPPQTNPDDDFDLPNVAREDF